MEQSEVLEDWKKRSCILATMHNKEKAISPVFSEKLGINPVVPLNFDTDRFGTFTHDVKRSGNQLEAARKKALTAMELNGFDLALASEGSFGPHLNIPFLQSNLEIVLLVDKKNSLEIIGHHRNSSVQVLNQKIHTPDEAALIAQSWGFPEQGVILRLSEKDKTQLYKEITTVDELKKISNKILSNWFTKSIFLETDMRAHRCPGRMESIRKAAEDLVKNCLSLCPKCSTPGFVIVKVIKGLPCNDCGSPTEITTELVYSCQKCLFRESQSVDGSITADPGQCEICNP